MYRELKKIELDLKFSNKRNYKIITPCCSKSNKDGKFVNYVGFSEVFGYCHSCGKASLPPTQYADENGNVFEWNDLEKQFIQPVLQLSHNCVGKPSDNMGSVCPTIKNIVVEEIKYIDNQLVKRFLNVQPENNLLYYIGQTYGEKNKDLVKNMYKLGTSKDGGIIFWCINVFQKAQKAKVVYYNNEGRREQKFKVPFLKSDGYFSCLFGEHLMGQDENKQKPIILVESEKTAIVCAINLPNYLWISYGGINGLTNDKLKVLIGKKVILVPDISNNAVTIMKSKLPYLFELGIDAKIWDMTEGKTDDELKEEGLYNCDLEDFLRKFV